MVLALRSLHPEGSNDLAVAMSNAAFQCCYFHFEAGIPGFLPPQ
jgi:hypothetical protein